MRIGNSKNAEELVDHLLTTSEKVLLATKATSSLPLSNWKQRRSSLQPRSPEIVYLISLTRTNMTYPPTPSTTTFGS